MTKRKASVPPLTDEEEALVQAGIAQDPDNPEITAEQFARMRPASEVLPPALFKALTKRGRPRSENKAVQVTLRVDPAVLEAYRSTGPRWQTRMNEALSNGAATIIRSGTLSGAPASVRTVTGSALSQAPNKPTPATKPRSPKPPSRSA